ncbi:MAG: hypothetical protein LBR59_02665 [Endomicrobium sp.]|nr:hypothetical protein [Endomicrobium sp.]
MEKVISKKIDFAFAKDVILFFRGQNLNYSNLHMRQLQNNAYCYHSCSFNSKAKFVNPQE